MIFTLLHNLFIQINIYTDNPQVFEYVSDTYIGIIGSYSSLDIVKRILKGALFSSREQMFGACWFLKILFMVSVCYVIGDFLAKTVFKKNNLLIQFIASIVLLGIGYFCSLYDISAQGIAQTASFYCLYFIGHLLALAKDRYSNWNWKYFLPIFVISFALLFWLNPICTIALNQNQYVNPLFLLVTSLSGWAFLYSSSYFFKFIPGIREILICIGKRTLSVVCLHFLCMKMVEVVVVKYYGMPYFCVAAFPNLYGSKGLWWLAYTVVATGVPVLADMLYRSVCECLNQRRK